MIELSGFADRAFPGCTVVDPAAGDGALLVPAVHALSAKLACLYANPTDLAMSVVGSVHAIELDAGEARRCRENLSRAVLEATGVQVPAGAWDVIVGDACTEWARFRGKADFVLMNPPYVRIHNMASKPDSAYISGMCDLYYAFFDYAQRMLSESGKLCAIAPSSWMTSSAGAAMRDDLRSRGVIEAVCGYGHLQVFAPYATAYTALVLIGTRPSGKVAVWGHGDDGSLAGSTVRDAGSCWHAGLFMPDAPDVMDGILSALPADAGIAVRNGYATNLDGFFMSRKSRFGAYEIPVVKASRAEMMRAVYPYDASGELIPLDEIRLSCPDLAAALEGKREALEARSKVDPSRWWCYARTQGIADTYADKVAVQSLVRPPEPPRTLEAPAGTGVFAGIYVVGMGKDELDDAVSSAEFLSYVSALGKYKNGGYYAMGGRDLERFLAWWRTR
jgi:adenine-specific DNA-methyltransferase